MKINIATLALLATAATAVPMSAVDTLTWATVTTTAPGKTPTLLSALGPGDQIEACIMPYGCRNNTKHDAAPNPPPKLSPSDAIEACRMPHGCRNNTKHDPPSKTRTYTVPTETSTATTNPGFDPMPTITRA